MPSRASCSDALGSFAETEVNGIFGFCSTLLAWGITAIRRMRRASKSDECFVWIFPGPKLQAVNKTAREKAIERFCIGDSIVILVDGHSSYAQFAQLSGVYCRRRFRKHANRALAL